MAIPNPPPQGQVPPQPPAQPPPAGKSIEQEVNETVDLVKREVPTSLEGMGRLPLPLLLILLGGALAILLGLLLFLVDLAGRHPLSALAGLGICVIFGAGLVVSFALMRRDERLAILITGVCALVLAIAGGTAGFIGGLLALGGVGIILLRKFGILDK